MTCLHCPHCRAKYRSDHHIDAQSLFRSLVETLGFPLHQLDERRIWPGWSKTLWAIELGMRLESVQLQTIALFVKREHSTVLYSIRRAQKLLAAGDKEMFALMDKISRRG